jgi:hypothetical protein
MALALVALGTFSSLLEVTLIDVRMARRAEYSAGSVHMCAHAPSGRGALYFLVE